MVKRHIKRRIRLFISFFLSALTCLVFAFFLVFGIRAVWPLTKMGIVGSSNKIIKPVPVQPTIAELSKKLNSENIILTSLSVSSTSGVFVGVVRDGPTVYFSDSQDYSWQVSFLSRVLSRTTADNKKPKVVDLTTSRPIVKF